MSIQLSVTARVMCIYTPALLRAKHETVVFLIFNPYTSDYNQYFHDNNVLKDRVKTM